MNLIVKCYHIIKETFFLFCKAFRISTDSVGGKNISLTQPKLCNPKHVGLTGKCGITMFISLLYGQVSLLTNFLFNLCLWDIFIVI